MVWEKEVVVRGTWSGVLSHLRVIFNGSARLNRVLLQRELQREREREQEKEGVGVIIRWKKKKDGSLKLESYKRKARKSQNTHEMKATEIIFQLLPGK